MRTKNLHLYDLDSVITNPKKIWFKKLRRWVCAFIDHSWSMAYYMPKYDRSFRQCKVCKYRTQVSTPEEVREFYRQLKVFTQRIQDLVNAHKDKE